MVTAPEIPPEILVSIFEWNQRHKDLLNCALVCRGWTEWAIDARWRTCQVPLSNILAILGLTNETDPDVDYHADWTKFVAISNRVTKVKCDFTLSAEAVAEFHERRKQQGGDALFQNVRELIVIMGATNIPTISIPCSSESPKSIRMYRARNIIYSWVYQSIPNQSLASCAPDVEYISVDYGGAYTVPSVSCFAQLCILECKVAAVRFAWWKDLAGCPKLTDLRLRDRRVVEEDARVWGEVSVVFPVLEKLHYHTTGFGQAGAGRVTAHLKNRSPLLQVFRRDKDYVAEA